MGRGFVGLLGSHAAKGRLAVADCVDQGWVGVGAIPKRVAAYV